MQRKGEFLLKNVLPRYRTCPLLLYTVHCTLYTVHTVPVLGVNSSTTVYSAQPIHLTLFDSSMVYEVPASLVRLL